MGKTTLLLQTIRYLIETGIPPQHIFYATFDHPVLKLTGADALLKLWQELQALPADKPIFLFLDEIQYVENWQTWLKHRADFQRQFRIMATGSAIPLMEGQESGVGRWQTVKLPTLSFYEYLQLKQLPIPDLPPVKSLTEVFDWSEGDFLKAGAQGQSLVAHFHDYLVRGGFPEPAMKDDLKHTQRLLRDDIVDKVLKRDMTALFGVRRVVELEKVFLYLCFHDGGIFDVSKVAQALDVSKQTVINFLDLFEQCHLVYRLRPFGYGKEVLRGRSKYYLADPAISGSVLMLGKRLLERTDKLGAAVEAAFFKHLFTRHYQQAIGFSYWQDKANRDREVDVIAETGGYTIPFEVKYQDAQVGEGRIPGLRLFCEDRKLDRGYVITRQMSDFQVLPVHSARPRSGDHLLPVRVLKIPAPLACLWLSVPTN